MRGKAKLERCGREGKYRLFFKDWPWQRWKPFHDNNGEKYECDTLHEFIDASAIECFDRIVMRVSKFSGLGRTAKE